MAQKIKKRVKNSPKWKQTVASRKRRSGKAGLGLGRYVLGIIALAILYHTAVRPVVRRIQAHPIFTVRHVLINGARYLGEETVADASRIDLGGNIFDIDIEAVSGRLTEAFAAEDFTVYRSLPGTIAITIREKQPVALLNAEKLIGIDANGDPLPHIGADLVDRLPIITGVGRIDDLADSTVRERLRIGLRMLDALRDKAPSTYKRISELNVANLNDLGISLVDNGLDVVIGDKDWSRKIPVLDRIINEVTSRRKAVKAVDIRFGEVVVVK